MRIPGWWEMTLLVFGAFRMLRFVSYDEWPPVAKLRAWVIGEQWVPGEQPTLPGKTPETDFENVRVAYRRPMLAHLVHCPFALAGGSPWPSTGRGSAHPVPRSTSRCRSRSPARSA